jgi:hypothetical protein
MAIATRLNHPLRSIGATILRQRQSNMGAVEEWRKLSNLEFSFRRLCTEKHQLLAAALEEEGQGGNETIFKHKALTLR